MGAVFVGRIVSAVGFGEQHADSSTEMESAWVDGLVVDGAEPTIETDSLHGLGDDSFNAQGSHV